MTPHMVFLLSFLGSLFAILASLLAVYTYITLRLLPKFRRFMETEAQRFTPAPQAPSAPVSTVRVVFTCEDHGRCAGCPRVLAQFEAIVRHQGVESFDDVERRCYEQLRAQFAPVETAEVVEAATTHPTPAPEVTRQRLIASLVVDTLVNEGYTPKFARAVVWGCGKAARATFDAWLSAARDRCLKLSAKGADSMDVVSKLKDEERAI